MPGSSPARLIHAVASVLLATRDGHVLLALTKVGWGTVGGHVEQADPSLRAAAAREAEEELVLALDPADLAPLLFLPDTMVVRPGHAHWDFCYVTVVDEQVPVTAADDVTDARWFAFDDVPELNGHMRALVDAAISHGWRSGRRRRLGHARLLAVRVERQFRHREG